MQRVAGILMPIPSLPSECGIGTLGKAAYRFADYLKSAGCGLWQVLPLFVRRQPVFLVLGVRA